jgi:biotin carboxyl carrier protein
MRVDVRIDGEDRPREHEVWATRTEDTVELEVDGDRREATVERTGSDTARVELDGETLHVTVHEDGTATVDGTRVPFRLEAFHPGGAPGEHETLVEAEGAVEPPMPGTLVTVHVQEGDAVETGDPLGVLEAMKMQSTIEAPRSGTVLRVHAEEGDAVEGDQVLFEVGEPPEDEG